MTYYKATRPDGTDFFSGKVDYGAALASGEIVSHPSSDQAVANYPDTYLSISVEPTGTMVGGKWPCRLFEVEPVGEVLDGLSAHPHKRTCTSLRVLREVESWRVFGPNGNDVAAIIERASRLSGEEVLHLSVALGSRWSAERRAVRDAAERATWRDEWGAALDAARSAAWEAAWSARWGVALNSARSTAWEAAELAAQDAVTAHLARDLISDEHFNTLYGPWNSVIRDM